MHITLEADYAVRIVYYLVCAKGRRVDAKIIAENTGVTLRFSLKILRKLVAGGIVKSYKGTHGGYEMAQPPEQISLYDVLQTVEGPYVLSRCVLPDFECSRKQGCDCPPCKFNAIYRQISEEVREKLQGVCFAELMD